MACGKNLEELTLSGKPDENAVSCPNANRGDAMKFFHAWRLDSAPFSRKFPSSVDHAGEAPRNHNPIWLVTGGSLWLATAANFPLWRELSHLALTSDPAGLAFSLAMMLIIAATLMAMLSLFAWRWTLKPVLTLMLFASAFGAYFMWSYRVVIDATMMINVLQTDVREAADLFSPRLVVTVLVLAVLPSWTIWRLPIGYGPWSRRLLQNFLMAIAAVILLAVSVVLSYQPLASTMRNHKQVRYLMNPLNSMYALGYLAAGPLQRDRSVLEPIGLDARSPEVASNDLPPLIILVVGETARSGNFSINGYPRPTTPKLGHEEVASFRNVSACGTSTAVALPCMFSNLGRTQFDARSKNFEGLLDVIQRAGMAVLWLDNQSGCKAACDRVGYANTSKLRNPQLCPEGACYDAIMLEDLDARIAALPAKARARGVVLVLHAMGSHGPAYYLRSPQAFKQFGPECSSNDLQNCSQAELLNAYDNSIIYTDHFLDSTIHWLRTQQATYAPAMVYVGDHGESLGENNLYLHGLPYAIAPDVQTRVPWFTWLSPRFASKKTLTPQCLHKKQEEKITHDNYFHSVLGLLSIKTVVYQPQLDVYASCTGTR